MRNLWIVLALVVATGLAVMQSYNNLVTLNESIKGKWAQVENQLQRRNDLIPNLVNTVKGYAKHEKEIFIEVSNARARLAGATSVSDKIKASQALDSVLSRLLAIAENYPQLRASDNFIRLQDELAGTENRIAVERMRYNEVVLSYNVAIKKFPGNIIASIFKFEEKDAYFKPEEKNKEVPKVDFDSK